MTKAHHDKLPPGQQYCKTPDEITNKWLSAALNADVESVDKILCTQRQPEDTVVLKNIMYSGTAVRPSSVELKM